MTNFLKVILLYTYRIFRNCTSPVVVYTLLIIAGILLAPVVESSYSFAGASDAPDSNSPDTEVISPAPLPVPDINEPPAIIPSSAHLQTCTICKDLPIHTNVNQISNRAGLSRLAEKLHRLASNSKEVVTIVQIGDSHVQAGGFSSMLRRGLQSRFGNAGRGLIFPYRVLKSNGPEDYRFSKTDTWGGQAIVRRKFNPQSVLFPGISGYVVQAISPNACLQFTVDGQEDRFCTIRLFNQQCNGKNIAIQSSGSSDVASWQLVGSDSNGVSTFENSSLVSDASISLRNNGSNEVSLESEGIILLNGKPGVVFHTIGINGASVPDYLNAQLFWKQLPELHPDLVIVSLGTNDAYGAGFNPDTFEHSMDSLYSLFTTYVPGAEILITTAADNDVRIYKKSIRIVRKKHGRKIKKQYLTTLFSNNARAAECRNVLIRFCNKNNIAYWDMYEVMGGRNSMRQWASKGFAAKDHVHFTPQGYCMLSTLLDSALESCIDKDPALRWGFIHSSLMYVQRIFLEFCPAVQCQLNKVKNLFS